MGRYSSVQAYADNNANARSVSYDQATGGGGNKGGGVVTEKVSNPYGSTAGAGSGEFHVYRHARAREAARWKEIDAQEKEKSLEEEFHQILEQAQTEEEQKTAKRRRKRQREKEAKQRKKVLKASGIVTGTADTTANEPAEEEFTYVPRSQQNEAAPSTEDKDASATETKQDDTAAPKEPSTLPSIQEIPNDGSFLELMKKQLEQNKNGDTQSDAAQPQQNSSDSRPVEEDDEGPPLPPGFQ